MMTRGRGNVEYEVQITVDTRHYLIGEHNMKNTGRDRGQLSRIAKKARIATGTTLFGAIADRGYFDGKAILSRDEACLKTLTGFLLLDKCVTTRAHP